MSQICQECRQDKDESEFYLTDGYRLWKVCKACVRARHPKKPKGFDKLPKEKQDLLRAAIRDRSKKLTQIAREHEVNYDQLCKWVRAGKLQSP